MDTPDGGFSRACNNRSAARAVQAGQKMLQVLCGTSAASLALHPKAVARLKRVEGAEDPPLRPRDRICCQPALLSLSPSSSSQVNCKAAITFFQYSVLANFYWLLVEGMYLQTLLLLTFTSDKRYICWYILIGWGECGASRHMKPPSVRSH